MKQSFASKSSSDLTAEPSGGGGVRSGGRKLVPIIPMRDPSPPPQRYPWDFMAAEAERVMTSATRMSPGEWAEALLPCLGWMKKYDWRAYLQADLIAGITVGVMLVPQGMSYAKLAGLEPIFGLYSSFIPVFIYAILGSSRQLAVGPVALVSLMVSNVLGNIRSDSLVSKASNEDLYTQLAILLALMVGIMQVLMASFRLGWIIRFISHSVISGFSSASAIVIGLSQIKYFFGYHIDQSSKIVPIIRSIVVGIRKFTWQPFVLGSIFLVILIVMKNLGKKSEKLRYVRAAGPLTVVVLGVVFVKIFHPPAITVVGHIPQGVPSFSVPLSSQLLKYVSYLIPTALIITGVAILESVGIAKNLAIKNGYDLDSNRELFGLGVANVCGSFFSSYPATGSFSRSAVNNESGAKTGLSGIVTGVIIGCTLLFMTPLFSDVPQCALAAIVISAVVGLVDYEEASTLWKSDKRDFLLWIITFIVTLFFGIEIGVLVGVGFSLAFVIHETANPHIAVLGRLPGTTVYRNTEQYPEAYTYNGIVVLRVDAPIYFANISYIKDRLREYELNPSNSTKGPDVRKIHFVILDLSPVTSIDSSGIRALKELQEEYQTRHINIGIANPKKSVHRLLLKSGIIGQVISKDLCFARVDDAVRTCLQRLEEFSGREIGNIEDPASSKQPNTRYGEPTSDSIQQPLLQN